MSAEEDQIHELTRGEFIRELVGREHKVDVWRIILGFDPDNTFRSVDVLRNLQIERVQLGLLELLPQSTIHKEVLETKKLGMIAVQVIPRPANGRDVHYRRIDSPVWGMAAAAIKTVQELYPLTLLEPPTDELR